MQLIGQGAVEKMAIALDSPAQYQFRLGDQLVPVNPLLGKQIRLEFLAQINCQHCGRKTKKSFSQGYCYNCFRKLPQCDTCIMSPERCHFHAGTCRDSAWGEQFCMTDHVVYLANSSGLKVGITRASQVPTRWLDQGAAQAVPIMRVATRQQSGFVEDLLRGQVADKTNWRTLLKSDAPALDLLAERDRLFDQLAEGIHALQERFGLQAVQPVTNIQPVDITYPVIQYPVKIVSLDLEKLGTVEGTLLGIKGQYLILDTGVINIRKYTAYHVAVSAAV